MLSVRAALCSQFATLKGYFYTNLVGTLMRREEVSPNRGEGIWKVEVEAA
jgi:hypothetical protein